MKKKNYAIFADDRESEEWLENYCTARGIQLRKHYWGFVDYNWYNADLLPEQADKLIKESNGHNISLLKKTITTRKRTEFFIDEKEKDDE